MLTNRWAGFRKSLLVEHDKERQKEGRARPLEVGGEIEMHLFGGQVPNTPDAFISN